MVLVRTHALVALLAASAVALDAAAETSLFRIGEARVKGGTLQVDLHVAQSARADIEFYGFAAPFSWRQLTAAAPEGSDPPQGAAKLQQWEAGAQPYLPLGTLDVDQGAHSRQLSVSLKDLAAKIGVKPGDTLHVGAYWRRGGEHTWGYSEPVRPEKIVDTTCVVPQRAKRNSLLAAPWGGRRLFCAPRLAPVGRAPLFGRRWQRASRTLGR